MILGAMEMENEVVKKEIVVVTHPLEEPSALRKKIGKSAPLIVCFFFPFVILSLLALMMGAYGWWVVITSLFFGFMLFFLVKTKENDDKKALEKTGIISQVLKDLNNFSVTQLHIVPNLEEAIAIDENSKIICFINNLKIARKYSYKDILECHLIEDGVAITKSSRGSQIGGALVGGLIAGGVGAIIGGLSGQKTSTNLVKSLDLKIIVKDTVNPFFIINFMNNVFEPTGGQNKIGESKESGKYKYAFERITHWQSLISVLIKRANEDDNVVSQNNTFNSHVPVVLPDPNSNNKSNFVADELLKLSELLKQGIITESEFELQKGKLLSDK
jgi:hypothetical protein